MRNDIETATKHPVQCEVSTILDPHKVFEGSESREDKAVMTDDGASTEDNDSTENNGETTEYSPAMTENDDSDAAEHEASEESTPVQKKR